MEAHRRRDVNNDLVVYQEPRQLTAVDIQAQVQLVQQVMRAVMKNGTHYGTIPGTPKPTLFKAGADILAATFRIAISYKLEELSTADAVRYRVTAIGTHQTSGIVMGSGMGECSSSEEKYKWRKAVGKEFDATPEDRRRVKFSKDWTTNQVRTDPVDLANTVLKMGCKRSQVAMILNVTAASDIFVQDLASEDDEPRQDAEPEKRDTAPKPYPPDQFAKNLPAWTKLIQDGKKSSEQICSMVSSKAVLSNEMRAQILAIKPAQAQGNGGNGAPDVTFAQVADRLHKAPDLDLLAADADLIRMVADEGQRAELSALYNKRKAELGEK
jgi:hypothetical protein